MTYTKFDRQLVANLLAAALMSTSVTMAQPASTGGQQEPDPRLDPKRIQFEGEELPFSLTEAVVRALDNNLDIKIVSKDVEINDEGIKSAEGIYDPVLGAVASTGRQENETAFSGAPGQGTASTFETDVESETAEVSITQLITTGATISLGYERFESDIQDARRTGTFNPQDSQAAFITLRQPLLKNFGPKVTNLDIRTSKLRRDISVNLYRQEIENRIAQVLIAYWDLVFAIGNLDVQRVSLESALELERVNEVRVRTGASPQSDLYQAQAEAANRRNSVIVGKQEILQAQDTLFTLLNWDNPETEWNRPVVPTDAPDDYDLDLIINDADYVNTGVARRHDLEAARLSLETSELRSDALWWQRLPELNLFGTYGYNGFDDNFGDSFSDISDAEYDDWVIGAEFRYPLLNRSARGQYNQSRLEEEQALLQLENLELTIIAQVRRAARILRTSQESIEASNAQVKAAEETLKSERKRLDVGSSTTFQVLDFQEDLAIAQVNQLNAQTTYQKGLVELYRSSGILLDQIGEDLGVDFVVDYDEP